MWFIPVSVFEIRRVFILKIKSQEDFWAGMMFIGFGSLAIYLSWDYPFGSASRMGPGYFPTWLGIIMAVLGIAITLTSFRTVGEKIAAFAWKPIILLGIGFMVFGWSIDHIGFIPATAILVVLGAAAGRDFRIKEVIPLTIGLLIGCWALFIKGLDLPFPLFWWR